MMKKNLFIFFVLFTILAVFITLFPPVRPRGFKFLFSDVLIRIDTSRLILEYVLAIFLSALGYLFYIKTSKKVKLFSLYIVVSIVSTFCFYLLLSPTLNLFSPSYNQVKAKEDYLYSNYANILSSTNLRPYKLGEYLFLDSTIQMSRYADLAFNNLILPDSLLPPIDSFLITKFENDSLYKVSLQKSESNSKIKRYRISIESSQYGVSSFNILPYAYRGYYHIPANLLLQEHRLLSEINSLKYDFYKSHLNPFLDFYVLKNNYLESEKSFLSLKNTLQKLFTILFFIVVLSLFYFKRNKLFT